MKTIYVVSGFCYSAIQQKKINLVTKVFFDVDAAKEYVKFKIKCAKQCFDEDCDLTDVCHTIHFREIFGASYDDDIYVSDLELQMFSRDDSIRKKVLELLTPSNVIYNNGIEMDLSCSSYLKMARLKVTKFEYEDED